MRWLRRGARWLRWRLRGRGLIVLWGARRGDVHYASRAYWRNHLQIGAMQMLVDGLYFDVGDVCAYRNALVRVIGREREGNCQRLAVEAYRG